MNLDQQQRQAEKDLWFVNSEEWLLLKDGQGKNDQKQLQSNLHLLNHNQNLQKQDDQNHQKKSAEEDLEEDSKKEE